MLIDETAFTEGKLTTAGRCRGGGKQHGAIHPTLLISTVLHGLSGVNNFKILERLVEEQVVGYDMGISTHDFYTECPIISISTTKSVIRKGFTEVPIDLSLAAMASTTTTTTTTTTTKALSPTCLDRIRHYLALVGAVDVKVTEQVGAQVEEEFLQARRQQRDAVKVVDLDRWYTMIRIMAASLGRTEVTIAEWERVKELEHQRGMRLSRVGGGRRRMSQPETTQ